MFRKKNIIYVVFILLSFFTNIFFSPTLNAKQSISIIRDSEIDSLIDDIMYPILLGANINPSSVSLYVINDNSPNAFVYGGQNIFVTTGLITLATSYNEIAGVLAHELAHINAGHLSRGNIAYSKASMVNLLGLAGLIITAPFLASGNSNLDIIGFLSYSTMMATEGSILNYSRSEESHADQIALEYILNTDYNPKGFYDFMYKLYSKENKEIYSLPTYALRSTHPLTTTRMAFIDNYIKNNPKEYKENNELLKRLVMVQAKIRAYNNQGNIYQYNSNPYLYYEAIKFYNSYDLNSSISFLKKLLKESSDNIYVKELIGDTYLAIKDYESAIQYYQPISKKVYNQDLLYYKMALAHFSNSNNNEALRNSRLSLQINSKNPAGWHLQGLAFAKKGLIPQADLAMAEKFLLISDRAKALSFAQKALQGFDKNTNEYIQAMSIISSINGS